MWLVGNDSFEVSGMVHCMVECVTLLVVSGITLCCSWYESKANGECTSEMITLPWWNGVFEVCVGDWRDMCKVVVVEHDDRKGFSFGCEYARF